MSDPTGLNTKTASIYALLNTALEAVISWLSNLGLLPDIDSHVASADGKLDTTNSSLADLVDHVGIPTGDATTTVLGYLAEISNRLRCVCGDFPPPTTGTNACESPLESRDDVMAVIGSDGRNYITWPDPLPGGLEFESDGTYGPAKVGIVLSDTTGTYSLYVESRASTFRTTSGAPGELPCNRWLPVDAGTTLELSVPAGELAKAFICYAPAPGFVDCVNVGSDIGNYTQLDTSAVFNSSYAVWASIPGITTTDTEEYSGHTFQWNTAAAVAVADGFGWTFTKNSGPDIRLLAKHSDGTFTSYTISSTPFTITEHTTTLWCDLGSGGSTEAFSFQVCPPA